MPLTPISWAPPTFATVDGLPCQPAHRRAQPSPRWLQRRLQTTSSDKPPRFSRRSLTTTEEIRQTRRLLKARRTLLTLAHHLEWTEAQRVKFEAAVADLKACGVDTNALVSTVFLSDVNIK